MSPTRILVLDRSEALADQVRSAMDEVRPSVIVEVCTRIGVVGDVLTEDGPFDVLVAGPSLGTRAGLARLEVIHDELPAMSLVLAFARRPTAALREIVRTGACDLLQMPIDDKELRESLVRAIELTAARPTVVADTAVAATPAPAAPVAARAPGRVFTTSSA